MQELTGQVERVTFRNEETGYSVLKIKADGHGFDRITVTVNSPLIVPGSEMTFKGNWEFHPQFGKQFKADSSQELLPTSLQGIQKFLGSGLIKGIGPQMSKKIVQKFGTKTFEVFDTEPQKLLIIKGISENKLKKINKSWKNYRGMKEVLSFLKENNLTTGLALKLVTQFGEKSISILKENPYQIIRKIRGVGFLTIDQMASNLGFKNDDPKRIMAGILESLHEAKSDGHLYLTKDQIYSRTNEVLEIDASSQVENLLKVLIKEEKIILEENRYYPPVSYFSEIKIAKKIKELKNLKFKDQKDLCTQWAKVYCEKENIQLSDEQFKAVIGIANQGFSILTGGPGVGKTTTTKVLYYLLKAMNKRIVLAAPTGRAAQRMSEVIGQEAKTIHRLLNWIPGKGEFERNEHNPLDCDFLIVDESSMLDNSLTCSLLSACHNNQVLFIGDPDQLPSVGPGNILLDLINSKEVPLYRLTQVFRQGRGSKVIEYAHQINSGICPKVKNPFEYPSMWKKESFEDAMFLESEEFTKEQSDLVQRIKSSESLIELPEKFSHIDQNIIKKEKQRSNILRALQKKISEYNTLNYNLTGLDMINKLYTSIIPKYFPKEEIQILAPMKNGALGTINLNKHIQNLINPKKDVEIKGFRKGDRVIQLKNNYDLSVFNGDIGKIINIDEDDEFMEIDFSTKIEQRIVTYPFENIYELDLAYAITIHKSQGSEFGIVILPITMSHFTMLFRNLIYTGLTRAKKLALFVGSRKALFMGVKNLNPMERQTTLEERLRNN